jgi:peptidyl-tRNA hydrolase, PTH1 family
LERVCCVGLGNPGHEYAETRHNVGFRVVDLCARRLNARWGSRSEFWEAAEGEAGEVPVLLVKPQTYMNLSGRAVAEVLGEEGVAIERTIVILDDLALPLGRLRMRGKGSDGGHNGLASIIFAVGTTGIPRLRCGIGIDPLPVRDDLPAFVLSPFGEREQESAARMIERAADAVMMFAQAGIASAMSRYNSKL